MNNIDYISGESWKIIAGYDKYLVSNYGRIYSLKHRKILSPFTNTANKHGDYLFVKLSANGRKQNHRIHRLVAEAFIENTYGKPIVHHIDCNIKNNRADNLMWCTREEHTQIHRGLRQKAREQNG